jgi:hypothetical protein
VWKCWAELLCGWGLTLMGLPRQHLPAHLLQQQRQLRSLLLPELMLAHA